MDAGIVVLAVDPLIVIVAFVLANAVLLTVVILLGIVIEVRLEQPLKALPPITLILLPIVRVVKDVTLKNMDAGIVVLADDPLIVIVAFVLANAPLTTLVILFGIVIEVKPVQPLKELLPITLILPPIVRVVKDPALENMDAGIVVLPDDPLIVIVFLIPANALVPTVKPEGVLV